MFPFASWFHRAASSDAPREKNGCRCCGGCCRWFGGHLHASQRDIQRWQQQGRDDLLRRVNRLNWIWIDPETGQLEDLCPFITPVDDRTVACAINDTKPDICRDYPTLAHGGQCLRGIVMK